MTGNNKETLNTNSVILITGGAKGITSQCTAKIAETAKCKFILVGRSVRLDSEPKWAEGVDSAKDLKRSALAFFKEKGEKITPKKLEKEIKNILSSREINATLEKVDNFGGSAVYISADVTNEKSLTQKVHAAVKKFGPVTGVIHGAGNLADKRIENKTADDFDLVVNTKVLGLNNIIKSIDPVQLKFLVLFSSVAGFFGNIGQSDYAIANEILNKSAHIIQKSLPDCRVLSINWGPWNSGMVSPELKKVFRKRNIQLISTDFGVETLINEISSSKPNNTQIVVGGPLEMGVGLKLHQKGTVTVQRQIDHKDNPFMSDHRIASQYVLPATCASAWLIDTCVSLNPGFKFFHLEDFKILKGLTFNDEKRQYEVELNPIPETNNAVKTYDVLVTSRNDKKRKVFHYSGRVTLMKEIPSPPMHTPIAEMALIKSAQRSGRDFYQNGTLFQGPSFQGVQTLLQLNETSVITRVSLPPMGLRSQGQFPVRSCNPYVNDAVVQSLLLWTQEIYDTPCLPSRLHKWDNYRMIPFGVSVWVILSVTFHSEHAVVGDILVQDEAGREYFNFTALEGTISKQLKRFIGKKA
ncbi:MAG: SDR family NAD(P)-dependent oxidoreductase [Anaerolineaceae bacterium]|nr:SDR family NAD(P)-dependent oxidoreductase [Anaerolineaceae bacterium]